MPRVTLFTYTFMSRYTSPSTLLHLEWQGSGPTHRQHPPLMFAEEVTRHIQLSTNIVFDVPVSLDVFDISLARPAIAGGNFPTVEFSQPLLRQSKTNWSSSGTPG